MERQKAFASVIVVVLTGAVIFSCTARSKFTPLFTGDNLNHWEVKVGPKEIWKIEDGAIICEGKGVGRGWLGTKKIYRDFVFSCEWKIVENGNSGVFLRVGDDPDQNPAYDAIEIQISDDFGSGYQKKKKTEISGAVYAVAGAKKQMYKGTNQWNKYVLTCKGTRIKVEYNGELVVDVDTRDYTEPFMWSSYKTPRMALNDRPREGYIALQSHGSGVWFRNISIKELK